MTSSERVVLRVGGVGGLALIVCVPFALGCGLMGDLTTMGCPEGEVCRADPEARFFRAGAVRCVSGPTFIDAIGGQSGSATVALGGTTWARASSTMAPTVAFSSEFESLDTDALGLHARAVTEGMARFSAYRDDGSLAEYLVLPVVAAARILPTDGLACPEQPRALLRGVAVRLEALALSAAGNPLVDTSSSVRTEAGDEVIIPTDGDAATVVMVAGTITERATLPIVDAAEELIPLVSPIEQLRGEIHIDGDWLCFQARAGGVSLLGLPITASRIEGPFAPSQWIDDTFSEPLEEIVAFADAHPGCLWLEPDGTEGAVGALEIEMAGLTARYTLVAAYR